MVLTKKILKSYREGFSFSFSKEQENELLFIFGTEPEDMPQWTEQDIHEHLRKYWQQNHKEPKCSF